MLADGLVVEILHVDLEELEPLVELVDAQAEVRKYHEAQYDDIGEQDAGDIGAGGDLIADARVEGNDELVQVEQDHKDLHADVGVVEEVELEGPDGEQVDEVHDLEEEVGHLDDVDGHEDHDEDALNRTEEVVVAFLPVVGVDAGVVALEHLEVLDCVHIVHVLHPVLVALPQLRVHEVEGRVTVQRRDGHSKVDVQVYEEPRDGEEMIGVLDQVDHIDEDGQDHEFPAVDEQLIGQEVVRLIPET